MDIKPHTAAAHCKWRIEWTTPKLRKLERLANLVQCSFIVKLIETGFCGDIGHDGIPVGNVSGALSVDDAIMFPWSPECHASQCAMKDRLFHMPEGRILVLLHVTELEHH
jgi:hypothetical protein